MQIAKRFPTEVMLLDLVTYADARGHFFESYNEMQGVLLGITGRFVQDNQSHSVRNVLRGMHYQIQHPQGKLVRVLHGEIYDVAIDLRRFSPTFGEWNGVHLTSEKPQMLWIPPGFAHGFLALSEMADVLYKTTDHYAPRHERTIRWDDPELGIKWPIARLPILSKKDAAGTPFRLAEAYNWLLPPAPELQPDPSYTQL